MTEVPTQGSAPKIFSYPVEVAAVPPGGLDVSIAADAETLRALAAADDLPSIARLEATFHLSPRGGDKVNVSGELRATITQICVVTLEPFETEIVEPIDVDFAPEDKSAARASSAAEAAIGDEALLAPAPPDPIIDGKIDLGALASEFLALGLDPYPRKPGARFEPPESGDKDAVETPFSILSKLKERS
ncbi:MAG: YceD family protein [Methylovirgula sp.]